MWLRLGWRNCFTLQCKRSQEGAPRSQAEKWQWWKCSKTEEGRCLILINCTSCPSLDLIIKWYIILVCKFLRCHEYSWFPLYGVLSSFYSLYFYLHIFAKLKCCSLSSSFMKSWVGASTILWNQSFISLQVVLDCSILLFAAILCKWYVIFKWSWASFATQSYWILFTFSRSSSTPLKVSHLRFKYNFVKKVLG